MQIELGRRDLETAVNEYLDRLGFSIESVYGPDWKASGRDIVDTHRATDVWCSVRVSPKEASNAAS